MTAPTVEPGGLGLLEYMLAGVAEYEARNGPVLYIQVGREVSARLDVEDMQAIMDRGITLSTVLPQEEE